MLDVFFVLDFLEIFLVCLIFLSWDGLWIIRLFGKYFNVVYSVFSVLVCIILGFLFINVEMEVVDIEYFVLFFIFFNNLFLD